MPLAGPRSDGYIRHLLPCHASLRTLVKDIRAGEQSAAVTADHAVIGTPLYMSPEALRAPESVTPRSDLYSLGAVAWFLLVGRPPFVGESVIEVCSQHLHVPPAVPSDVLGSHCPPSSRPWCCAVSPKTQHNGRMPH